MPKAYTGEEILESLRNLAMAPSTGALASRDKDLLVHVDEATRGYLIPRLLNLREDYFVRRQRSSVAAGQVTVRLSPRALFQKLRDLWWVSDGDRSKLDPIPEEEIDEHSSTGTGAGAPSGYIIEGNDIRLFPDSAATFDGELEQVFFFRPGDLVLSTAARQVLSVDLVLKTATLASAPPAGWGASNTFDVHSKHSGAEPKVWDEAAAIAGSVLTFTDPIDGTAFGTKAVEIGDWVCLAGEAALPGVPIEIHGLMARAGALQAAESIGDAQQVQVHGAILEKYLGEITKAMEVRVEGRPVRIGRGGFLTGRRRFGLRRGWR
jgi:hypothetical protein